MLKGTPKHPDPVPQELKGTPELPGDGIWVLKGTLEHPDPVPWMLKGTLEYPDPITWELKGTTEHPDPTTWEQRGPQSTQIPSPRTASLGRVRGLIGFNAQTQVPKPVHHPWEGRAAATHPGCHHSPRVLAWCPRCRAGR